MASVVEKLAEKYEISDPETPTVAQLSDDGKQARDVEWVESDKVEEKAEEKVPPQNDHEEVDAQPESKKEPKQETKEEVPTVPANLIDHAIQIGMAPDTARGFSTERDLTSAIAMFKSLASQAPIPEENTSEETRIAPEFEAFKLELDDEMVDESVSKNLKGMNDHVSKQMQAIATRQEEIVDAIMNDRSQRQFEWFDKRVNGTQEEVRKILGNRPSNTYYESDQEYSARVRLISAINRTLAGNPAMSPDDAFDREVLAEFKISPRTTTNKKQKNQAIGRPASNDANRDPDETSEDRLGRLYNSMVRENDSN